MIVDGMLHDRGIKELIRRVDTNKVAKKTCDEKFKNSSKIVHLQAQRQFYGAVRSAVKCMIDFNHHASRCKNFNTKLPLDR